MNPKERSTTVPLNLLSTEHDHKLEADTLEPEINKNVGWRYLWMKVLARDDN